MELVKIYIQMKTGILKDLIRGQRCDVANLINDEVVDITDYSVW